MIDNNEYWNRQKKISELKGVVQFYEQLLESPVWQRSPDYDSYVEMIDKKKQEIEELERE
jgi:hypothetical protein